MTDTIREKLINLVALRLDGYSWTSFIDAEDSSLLQPDIYKGRLIFEEDVTLPLITIVPGVEDSVFDGKFKVNTRTLPLTISAIINVKDVKTLYDISEPIMGEMEKALFQNGALGLNENDPETTDDYLFPFRFLGGGVADYPDELGSAIVTIGISAQVVFETRAGDPYN